MEPIARLLLRDGAAPASSVRVVAVGDTCLRSDAARAAARAAPAGVVAKELRDFIGGADIATLNLECVLERGSAISKSGPALSSGPELLEVLRTAGFDTALLANNHVLDQGPAALMTTLGALHGAGIRTAGAGENAAAAEAPAIAEASGLRVAVIAFAEREFSIAGESTPGAALLEPVGTARAVRRAREAADVVICNVHGGNEYHFAPSPRTQRWYRSLIDAGAHAVIGHHPHAIQGAEVWNGAPIFYSLGNFLFDSPAAVRRCWNQGLALRLHCDADGVREVECIGVAQQTSSSGAQHVAPASSPPLVQRFERLSEIARDPARVTALWRCFASERRADYSRRLLAGAGITRPNVSALLKGAIKFRSPHFAGLAIAALIARLGIPRRVRETEQAALLNLLRCPAHHELLTTIAELEHTGTVPSGEDRAEYAELIRDCRELAS